LWIFCAEPLDKVVGERNKAVVPLDRKAYNA
jgi:hypothetical protein